MRWTKFTHKESRNAGLGTVDGDFVCNHSLRVCDVWAAIDEQTPSESTGDYAKPLIWMRVGVVEVTKSGMVPP